MNAQRYNKSPHSAVVAHSAVATALRAVFRPCLSVSAVAALGERVSSLAPFSPSPFLRRVLFHLPIAALAPLGAGSLLLLFVASASAATNAPAAKPLAASTPRATNAPAARPTGAATTNTPVKKPVTAEDKLWNSANALLKQSKWRAAADQFEDFARQARNDPRYASALYNHGLCERKLGQDKAAIQIWNQVLQWDQAQTKRSKVALLTLDQLADYYTGQGQAEDTAKILTRMKTDYPDDPLTTARHAAVAARKLKAGDYAGALALYKAVEPHLSAEERKSMALAESMADQKTMSPAELLATANAAFEENDVVKAAQSYALLLKQNDGNTPLASEAKTRLGWCYYAQDKQREAEKLWREVIENAAGVGRERWIAQSRWHLIQLLAGPRNKVDDAIALCDVQAKACAGQMEGERALFTKAWLYWTRHQWTQSLAAFDELIKAYPENANDPPVLDYIRQCNEGLQAKK